MNKLGICTPFFVEDLGQEMDELEERLEMHQGLLTFNVEPDEPCVWACECFIIYGQSQTGG